MPGHFVGKMGSKTLFGRSAFKRGWHSKKTPKPGGNEDLKKEAYRQDDIPTSGKGSVQVGPKSSV